MALLSSLAAGAAAAALVAFIPHNAAANDAPTLAEQKAKRSAAAVRAFKSQKPCPATGKKTGPCPGYVVDHIQPLCAGGADSPKNMQWQTVAEAKKKDIEEQRLCRAKRKGAI